MREGLDAFLRAAALLGTLVVLGCGSPTPAPAYPTPEDPAIEDTEFAEVLGVAGEEEVVEEENAETNKELVIIITKVLNNYEFISWTKKLKNVTAEKKQT